MRVLSIIPIKNLNYTKTRLVPVLSPKERQALTLNILLRTIGVLESSGRVSEILVVTPDVQVVSFAKEIRILALRQEGEGLNEALGQATQWAVSYNFDAILILPSDLPLLKETDIGAIICAGVEGEKMLVISPDSKKNGTNALFVKPPGILKYCFGPNSFANHMEQTLSNDCELKVYCSPSIGFDLDSPEEYEFLRLEGHLDDTLTSYKSKDRFFDPNSRNTFHPLRG